jgi:hypothetical protein
VSSPVQPPGVFAVCLAAHTVSLQHRHLFHQFASLERTHECRREHATAPDGTRVPVTVRWPTGG